MLHFLVASHFVSAPHHKTLLRNRITSTREFFSQLLHSFAAGRLRVLIIEVHPALKVGWRFRRQAVRSTLRVVIGACWY
jgi:hypothetical protein